MPQLDRITQQPEVMGGKACIPGMRVTVGMLVGQIGAVRPPALHAWSTGSFDPITRCDLVKIVDDGVGQGATIITPHPIEH